VTAIALILATAVQLRVQGQPWWCACGQWFLITVDAWGSHNSQHLLDPYSLTHLLHGVLFCGLLSLAAPRLSLAWRFALAVAIECAWEVFENSSFVINRYRTATAALGYQGDSVANSLGDILSCAFGFWLAGRLGWWKSLVLFLAIEIVLLLWIRDCLVLNIVMLVFPLKGVRAWQTEGGSQEGIPIARAAFSALSSVGVRLY
jgi:hypothetical protein